jgi:tripartite-type tricarboxylate transporter receptor subunit TctC
MRATTLLLGLIACGVACAQDYPAKPIRLIVGFPPGGNVDVVGRIVAQKLGEGLSQQVLPENRTGAGSMIANEYVAKAAPDGYTLLIVSGAFVTQAATTKNLPYDPLRDFSFISTVVTYPLVFSVRADSRFRSLDEFIAYVKSNPGKVNYPSPGLGTLYHLAGELFVSMAGIDMQHVPFRGGSEPLTEVLSGRMELLIDALTNSYPQIQAGKFRPLAVSSLARSPSLPAVPTVADSVPGYEASSFTGIGGPAGMPPAVVERLNREVRRALASPDVGQRFAEWGGTPSASTPEEMQRLVSAEIEKWKKVVAARKLELP